MNYYNEIDKNAAAWLKELISAGLIPAGDVDDRSIKDVKGADLEGYTQCHFFAGIAGWSRALSLAGWPSTRPVWTGSCPCQSLSVAGLGKGAEDERHLWPEFARLICECEPAIVFGEQTSSKLGREWLDGISLDLEAMGYAVGAADLCAAGVGSPHIRQRLWWVADSERKQDYEKQQRPEAIKRERQTDSPCGCGVDSRVGIANGTRRKQGKSTGKTVGYGDTVKPTSGNSGMADPGLLGSEKRKEQATRREQYSQDSGLENPESFGRGRRSDGNTAGEVGQIQIKGSGTVGGLADGIKPGLEGLTGDGENRDQSGRVNSETLGPASESSSNFWSDSTYIPCGDGKARRVGIRPSKVVDGIPGSLDGSGETRMETIEILTQKEEGRVMLLKGYGNAIVPQVAAEFIKAVMNYKEINNA